MSTGPNRVVTVIERTEFLNFKACFSALVSSCGPQVQGQCGGSGGTNAVTYYVYSFDLGTVFIRVNDFVVSDSVLREGVVACHGRCSFTFQYRDAARRSSSHIVANFCTRIFTLPKPANLDQLFSLVRGRENFFLPDGSLDALHSGMNCSKLYQSPTGDRVLYSRMLLADVAQLYTRETLGVGSVADTDCGGGGRNHLFVLAVKEESIKRPMAVRNGDPEVTITLLAVPEEASVHVPNGSVNCSKYVGVVKEQQNLATKCLYCRTTFEYAFLKWLHYTWSVGEECLKQLIATLRAGQDSEPLVDAVKRRTGGALTSLLVEEFERFFPPRESNSYPCLSTRHRKESKPCRSALCYIWWTDSLDPFFVSFFSSFFPCFRCCHVFTTPARFNGHRCMKEPAPAPAAATLLRLAAPSAAVFLDTFYPSLPYQVSSGQLRCQFCLKSFEFVTAALAHYSAADGCRCLEEEEEVDLNPLFHPDLTAELEVRCDICSFVARSRLSYMMHRDHHRTDAVDQLVCKTCKKTFVTPCSFYQHRCSKRDVAGVDSSAGEWCYFCEELKNLQDEDGPAPSPVQQNPEQTVITLEGSPPPPPPPPLLEPEESDPTQLATEEEPLLLSYVDSHYVCTKCNPMRILRSFKLYVHFREFPDHAYRVAPLERFNQFDLRMKPLRLDT